MASSDKTKAFSLTEMTRLKETAENFVSGLDSEMETVDYFYRNKSTDYFSKIKEEEDGVMKPYIKDLTGNPRSPIHGELNGLFFYGWDYKSRQGVRLSPFGEKRLRISRKDLLQDDFRLYFGDFYCHHKPSTKRGIQKWSEKRHYVTIVATKPLSSEDAFCRRCLPGLPADNLFLRVGDTCEIRHGRDVTVELCYTEPVNLKELGENWFESLLDCKKIGRGCSNPAGIKTNPLCVICNLQLAEKRPYESTSDTSDDGLEYPPSKRLTLAAVKEIQ